MSMAQMVCAAVRPIFTDPTVNSKGVPLGSHGFHRQKNLTLGIHHTKNAPIWVPATRTQGNAHVEMALLALLASGGLAPQEYLRAG